MGNNIVSPGVCSLRHTITVIRERSLPGPSRITGPCFGATIVSMIDCCTDYPGGSRIDSGVWSRASYGVVTSLVWLVGLNINEGIPTVAVDSAKLQCTVISCYRCGFLPFSKPTHSAGPLIDSVQANCLLHGAVHGDCKMVYKQVQFSNWPPGYLVPSDSETKPMRLNPAEPLDKVPNFTNDFSLTI